MGLTPELGKRGVVQGGPPPILTVSFPEILTPATTWTNLEDIMLSEISQSQKSKYCMILLIRGP